MSINRKFQVRVYNGSRSRWTSGQKEIPEKVQSGGVGAAE